MINLTSWPRGNFSYVWASEVILPTKLPTCYPVKAHHGGHNARKLLFKEHLKAATVLLRNFNFPNSNYDLVGFSKGFFFNTEVH